MIHKMKTLNRRAPVEQSEEKILYEDVYEIETFESGIKGTSYMLHRDGEDEDENMCDLVLE